ncbi:MAG: hypothetical protein AB1627_02195 [Chloroflexota bacterium]
MWNRWTSGLLAWTLVLLVVGVVLAGWATASLTDAQQACFYGPASVPCPDGWDWRLSLLTFAFLGVPLIWLTGLAVAGVGWALRRRRRRRA